MGGRSYRPLDKGEGAGLENVFFRTFGGICHCLSNRLRHLSGLA